VTAVTDPDQSAQWIWRWIIRVLLRLELHDRATSAVRDRLTQQIRRYRARQRAEVQRCEREIGRLARQLADLQLGLRRTPDPEAKITVLLEATVEPVEPKGSPAPALRQKLLTELDRMQMARYVFQREREMKRPVGRRIQAVRDAMKTFGRARATIYNALHPYLKK
jgi:hypothetical protein